MKKLLTFVLLTALAGSAWAGSFNVSPIRVELSPGKPTQALSLTNESNEAVVIQVQAMLWSQQNWNDIHTPTDQVIATPPMVRIPARGRQVVRVGLRRPLTAGTEGTFRLYLTEMPALPKAGETGLHMRLRIDLPLFVTTSPDLRPDLRWSVAEDENGLPHVVVTNAGRAHVQLTDIRFFEGGHVIRAPQPAYVYVLPGATRRWPLANDSLRPGSPPALRVRASADYGAIDTEINTTIVARELHPPVPTLARD